MSKNKIELPAIDNIAQFEALFNHATIGIIVADSSGKIINFNAYAEKQFGYTKEDVLGQTIEILLPSKFKSSHVKLRDGFYKHPEPRQMGVGRDLFAQRKDGTEFPVEISLSYYEIKKEIFSIAFVIDITVRKKHEQTLLTQHEELERVTSEIKELNTELEQKVESRTKMLRETLSELEKSKDELSRSLENEKNLNELKSRFVTTASHEFRTPLSTILSSTFLLEKYNETNESQKREKHLHYIKEAVSDMKSILEDFLSLGKLEEGLIKPNKSSFTDIEFIDEVRKIIDEMRHLCKKDQNILFTHKDGFPVFIDKQLFRNILLNLISNAIKFSPEESVIKVGCYLGKENITVSVEDDGIGISEEDQQHLFERFFRAKNATNIQGTGLGLHIVTKYLELMNGEIKMESELNKGTTFTIIIPSKDK